MRFAWYYFFTIEISLGMVLEATEIEVGSAAIPAEFTRSYSRRKISSFFHGKY
jgi:hypothetical protein